MLSVRCPKKGALLAPLFSLTFACSHAPPVPSGPVPSGDTLIPLVDAQALQTEPGGQRVAPHFLGATTEEDGHIDWNLTLEAGFCYTVAGVGGQGVKHLYLYMWDPADKRVATEKPERPEVTLRYCPTEAGLFQHGAHVALRARGAVGLRQLRGVAQWRGQARRPAEAAD